MRLRRHRLEDRSKRISEATQHRSAVDRFLGRLEQALSMFAAPVVDDDVHEQIDNLRACVNELRIEINKADIIVFQFLNSLKNFLDASA